MRASYNIHCSIFSYQVLTLTEEVKGHDVKKLVINGSGVDIKKIFTRACSVETAWRREALDSLQLHFKVGKCVRKEKVKFSLYRT